MPQRKDNFIDKIEKNYGGHTRTGLLPEELQEIKLESPVTIIGYEILLTKALAVLCSLHFFVFVIAVLPQQCPLSAAQPKPKVLQNSVLFPGIFPM